MYRYSTRSERKHENCALVSSRAGKFPVLKLNSIQNIVAEVVTTTFRIVPTVAARFPTDRRAPARFPTGVVYGNRVSHGQHGRISNVCCGSDHGGHYGMFPDYEHYSHWIWQH